MFYNITSFDMHMMKNSRTLHSRTDTMKQVHCFKKRYSCGEHFL